MDTLQKAFDELIQELVDSSESAEELEKLLELTPVKLEKLIDELPSSMLEKIKRIASDGGLAERRRCHSEFVERNSSRWESGFDVLELLIEICTESGDAINARLRPAAVASQDIVFDVLVRLHAKACLVAREILCLLKNGFADGAHARRRALHELAVTALFLSKNGYDTAERYYYHEFIEGYKGALQHKAFSGRLQAAPLSEDKFIELENQYKLVVSRFGKNFKNPYGWAENALGKNMAKFSDLEEAVSLDHWRPYYKWASQNIHANAKTIKTSLGLSEVSGDLLQVGPSDAGMADPAHSTAISLSQITTTLLSNSPNLDDLVAMKMILVLCEDVGVSFLASSKIKL
ncbi:MAG: hypothetical protein KKE30_20520 [Gammaproteobacteria bacterium]|nr:hypothetical protein [Gammaproteobacteria bacterium]MBU1555184.1 hypothetical protein [Gammaproteobacteria bacterium]MBU2071139.1 hypothetical protein [Gammaproteobacteria bacterium]MBU2184411.1 hypothetical protein [Gammaproteobacteria bacterium]MBU2206207.1 hypothetical protein [Gammaproteobacteria bacterium]